MAGGVADARGAAMPLAALLGSAVDALQEARVLLDRAAPLLACGENSKAAAVAAQALAATLRAIRLSDEVDLGLRQALADAPPLCARAEPAGMDMVERQRLDERVAARQAPESQDLHRRAAELERRLAALLPVPASVIPFASR